MSEVTRIGWTQATWNPVTGCTRVSPGCDRCYIERTPPLRMARRRFDGPGAGATTGVVLHPGRLALPTRWRAPRRVFVCSLADLFHPGVPDPYLARVWAVMALTGRHTFQVLTKRHARLRAWLSGPGRAQVQDVVTGWSRTGIRIPGEVGGGHRYQSVPQVPAGTAATLPWPLPNVWVGVSAETQRWADLRVPALLAAPAAVRWISAEPLLGPIDLRAGAWIRPDRAAGPPDGPRVSWVVAGGESGPAARAVDPHWVRSLRDQCTATGTAFFFKQWGGPTPRTGGHDLDGRVWQQYPSVGRAEA